MADYIDIVVKVGDKKAARGIKDGMPVCYIDPDEWGFQPEYPPQARVPYLYLRAPSSWKSAMQAALLPIPEASQPDAENMPGWVVRRERSAYIDLPALETATGIVGLETSLRGRESVNVLDVRDFGLTTSIFNDADGYEGRGVRDFNQRTSGTYYVGSGQDYTTWSLAYADVGTTLVGTLSFVGKGSTVETATAVVTENLNGNVFNTYSEKPNYGDPTDTTYRVSANVNSFMFHCDMEGSGQFVFYDMYVYTQYSLTSNYHSITTGADPTTGYLFKVYNCLVDKNGNKGSGIVTGTTNGSHQIHDCVVWDQGGTAQGGILLYITAGASASRVENCTTYGCYRGIDCNSTEATLKNNAGFGSSNSDFYALANATGNNNASDDASADDDDWGTGLSNLTNQTASSCLNSTSDTDKGFLDINPSGNLVSAGTTNNLSRSACLRGRPLPNQAGSISIGAAELPRVGNIGRHHRNVRQG